MFTVNSVIKDFHLGTFFQNKRTVPVSQGKSQTNNTSCVIAIVGKYGITYLQYIKR